jgi:hypothetical protein
VMDARVKPAHDESLSHPTAPDAFKLMIEASS